MIIRDRQFEAFKTCVREGHLIDHLRGFAPEHVESIGDAGLRDFVRLGIERAAGFGWTLQGPLEFFLEIMVLLGSDFPTDPQYPWAAVALSSPLPEMEAADGLHSLLMAYHDRVLGPGLCYEIEAIERLLAADASGVLRQPPAAPSAILALLKHVYPQKCDYAGDAALSALLETAQQHTASLGLPPDGLALVAGILFSFGHGAFHDPQYPWIAASLGMEGVPKSAALTRVFRTYLERALANMKD